MKLFNQVKISKPKKSVFDLSHEKRLSLNCGELVPILTEEVLPGDKWKCNTELLVRMHQLLSPVMGRYDAHIHYFYIPWRLVFDNFDKFITGGEDGADNTPMPYLTIDTNMKIMPGSLGDYLGVPTSESIGASVVEQINALPFRAYQLVYNEFYRDQNLIDKVPLTKSDIVAFGEQQEIVKLRKRAWSRDYFTSALPWAQKGGSVMIPNDPNYKMPSQMWSDEAMSSAAPTGPLTAGSPSTGEGAPLLAGGYGALMDNLEGLDMEINDLRTAVRVQEWLEKNARAGSRLFESLLVHWGIISDDLRIGRPSFLGGAKVPISISEVLTSFENESVDLGQMGGHAIGAGSNANFKGYFKEYGCVMGILSVTPKSGYQQGLPKLFSYKDKFDFAWPEFANLGEQAILNKELYFDWSAGANNDDTFGYTPRYAHLKHGKSTVHGDFRTNLDHWHTGRIFANRPALNKDFIECDTSTIDDRIFPVADAQATDKLYVQLYHNIKAVRALPYFGTPRL